MTACTKSRQESNRAHQQVGAQPDTSHFIFLLPVREETCQNKPSGSRGLSKSHQSLCHLLLCFCARQRCQLPLEFLLSRELLCLAALPRDAAGSSCGCEPFQSALLSAPVLTPRREDPRLLQMPRHSLLCSQFHPTQIGAKLCQEASSIILLHNPFRSLTSFCCCRLHKAFQSY